MTKLEDANPFEMMENAARKEADGYEEPVFELEENFNPFIPFWQWATKREQDWHFCDPFDSNPKIVDWAYESTMEFDDWDFKREQLHVFNHADNTAETRKLMKQCDGALSDLRDFDDVVDRIKFLLDNFKKSTVLINRDFIQSNKHKRIKKQMGSYSDLVQFELEGRPGGIVGMIPGSKSGIYLYRDTFTIPHMKRNTFLHLGHTDELKDGRTWDEHVKIKQAEDRVRKVRQNYFDQLGDMIQADANKES